MAPARWFANAARRTLIACLPGLARPDDDFARSWLEPPEYRLYLEMDVRDRHHACEVARRLLALRPDARSELVRAALLHDLGKAARPFNPLWRIVAHLYAPATVPLEPLRSGLPGAWQVKRHHHRYGAKMITSGGGAPEVAELVARHHRPGGDAEAALLQRIDEET